MILKKSTHASRARGERRRGGGAGEGTVTHFPCHPSLPRSRRMGDGRSRSLSVGLHRPRPLLPATGFVAKS